MVSMDRRYLLSIDGGGIRGVIPAIALAELKRVTGQRARDTFSFVAGTSTGAIIAAAIAAGVSAERICDLYIKRTKEIFIKRPWNILNRIAFGSMYSTQKLHDLIADEIGLAPDETITVSLGTGRHISKQRPSGILQWLQWTLGQLLESPGEQQTEITNRQFPTMTFYRLDVDLGEDIALDDVGSVETLRKIGESFAQTIDWKAILAGSDQEFIVGPGKTLWRQYKS